MNSSSFIQKFNLIIAGIIYFQHSKLLALCIITVIFTSIMKPELLNTINNSVEKIVKLLGYFILKIFVIFTYVLTLLPLGIFSKKENIDGTTFKDVKPKRINFKRQF